MKVSVYILGARMHYAVPSFLAGSGHLEIYYTDFWSRKYMRDLIGVLPLGKYQLKIKNALGLRFEKSILDRKVVSLNLVATILVLLRRYTISREFNAKLTYWSNKFFCTIFSFYKDESKAVYCMNTAALEIFVKYKRKKILILEQCMLPRLDELELMRQIGLGDKMITKTMVLLAEREVMEWNLADFIITPSNVVKCALLKRGVLGDKIRVIPYGVDEVARNFIASIRRYSPEKRNPLKLLFVGEVGVRKGCDVLISAVKKFDICEVELTIVGKLRPSEINFEDLPGNIKLIGVVPRSEMYRIYSQSHVFVLPSLLEGSATVTYEAILSGLPIITTENAGSLVVDKVSGIIVDSGSVDSLSQAIKLYIDNPSLVMQHSIRSIELIPDCSISRYERDICEFFNRLEYAN